MRGHPSLSLTRQCRLLSIGRSSLYYQPKGESAETLALMRRIDELFLKYPFYGARQMVRHLRREGVRIGRRRAARLMRLLGLQAVYRAPRTSAPHPEHRVYPYLLRGLAIERPDHVWCADITYIPVRRGFLYLVAVMDWASRHVLAWRLSNTLFEDQICPTHVFTVIQPFDDGEYDKRFSDIYKPALESAGFEAFTVILLTKEKGIFRLTFNIKAPIPPILRSSRQGKSVDVLIDAIEEGISKATICLADISLDNPNVWYELGFASASSKPVILICSDKREGNFPFDIQHRSIIRYGSDSISDFEKLGRQISDKAKAALTPELLLAQAEMGNQLSPATGLSHQEAIVLGHVLASETAIIESTVSFHSLKHGAERAGLTSIGFGLAIRRLLGNKLVSTKKEHDYDGDEYMAVQLTDLGWKWIENNQNLGWKDFVLRRSTPVSSIELDDEIPF